MLYIKGGTREVRSVGRLRAMVRDLLREEPAAIDEAVRGVLGDMARVPTAMPPD